MKIMLLKILPIKKYTLNKSYRKNVKITMKHSKKVLKFNLLMINKSLILRILKWNSFSMIKMGKKFVKIEIQMVLKKKLKNLQKILINFGIA